MLSICGGCELVLVVVVVVVAVVFLLCFGSRSNTCSRWLVLVVGTGGVGTLVDAINAKNVKIKNVTECKCNLCVSCWCVCFNYLLLVPFSAGLYTSSLHSP